jgi:DNA-directed RNA polymerase subunit RPC12/RpoP
VSDVIVKCSQCGHECTVSEHASSGTITCPECHAELLISSENVMPKSKLQLKRKEEQKSRLVLDAEKEEKEEQRRRDIEEFNPTAIQDVHKTRETVKMPRSVWSWITFLAFAGALIGVQYKLAENPGWTNHYIMARSGIAALTALIICIDAFHDSTVQGLFCLFIPFYIIYYAFVRCDSYFLRGLTMAVLVTLGAELHFMGNKAVVLQFQQQINQIIAGGSSLIDRASDAPAY